MNRIEELEQENKLLREANRRLQAKGEELERDKVLMYYKEIVLNLQPGTPEYIMGRLFEEANKRGRPPLSAKHALTFFLEKFDEQAKVIKEIADSTVETHTTSRLRELARDVLTAPVAAGWESIAAQYARNADYYRGLVVEIGNMLGDTAFISDDGSRQNDVLCAKVPQLVYQRLFPQPSLESDAVCICGHDGKLTSLDCPLHGDK